MRNPINHDSKNGHLHYLSVMVCLLMAQVCCFAAPVTKTGGGGGTKTTTATTFSGQARVVFVDVLGGAIDLVLSDTGPLPSTGGALEKSLLTNNFSQNGVALSADALHATTVGQGSASRSEASVANLDFIVEGVNIAADFLMAKGEADCANGVASINASSEILNLRVAGQNISVSGAINQTVSISTALLNVTLIINEQNGSASGGTGAITVNALHVFIDSALTGNREAEVIISSAHADINCGGGPVCVGDFITGGGWITGTPSGTKGNFGVAGGVRNKGLWGHLNYIDHGTGMHVKATSITGYAVVDLTTRQITGTAEIDGGSGFTFAVVVSDKGEPGRSDTFGITLSNGYSASGYLPGGNIQLHNKPAGCR